MILKTWASILLPLLLCYNMATAQYPCPDLSPCYCYFSEDSGMLVTCNAIPMEDVKKMFTNLTSPIQITDLALFIQSSGDSIPADLLGESRLLKRLNVEAAAGSYAVVKVDPNAFLSSSSSIKELFLNYVDTNQIDFQFLKGFDNISELHFLNVINLNGSLPTLPALPSLKSLIFELSTGLNEAFKSSDSILQSNELALFYTYFCELDDKGVSAILDWLLPCSSHTLLQLELVGSNLTSMPSQLMSFQRLRHFNFAYNQVNLTIQDNAFNIQPNDNQDMFLFSFVKSQVVKVEPGAFQGNYSTSVVNFYEDSLTRLEEATFKSMLQDMLIGSSSDDKKYIAVFGNPFDCYSDPCHLAWLLVDNRHLLNYLESGHCQDGTALEDVSSNLFKNCVPPSSAACRPSFHTAFIISILSFISTILFHTFVPKNKLSATTCQNVLVR